MTGFLLDTNIVSETRRLRPHGGVMAWLDVTPNSELRVPAVAIGELQAGVERLRPRDAGRARILDQWVLQIAATFVVLSMDAATFRVWARMMDGRSSHLMLDAMIGAIAEVHGLVVATRNVRDFAVFGSRVLNPFDWKPD